MKKYFAFMTTVFAAATLMTACGDKDVQEIISSGPSTVQINVSAGIQTRAVNSSWTEGDAIGVFSMNGTTAEYANMQYTTADGDGNFEAASDDAIVWLPIEGTRSVLAYYPYDSSVSDGIYPVDVSSQDDQEAIDFMVSSAVENVSKTQPDVAFTFYHKLTKLVLYISAGEGITADQLGSMNVTITNQYTTGTCDVTADEEVTVSTALEPGDISFITEDQGESYEAIVLPAESTEGMLLQFEIPQVGTFSWAVSASSNSQQFYSGNKYVYNVSINKTSINVTSEIVDWTAGNGADGESVVAD